MDISDSRSGNSFDLNDLELVQSPLSFLKERRKELGLTQNQVAEAAGIKLRRYQRYEDGDVDFRDADFNTGMAVCFALKISPYDIFPEYRLK